MWLHCPCSSRCPVLSLSNMWKRRGTRCLVVSLLLSPRCLLGKQKNSPLLARAPAPHSQVHLIPGEQESPKALALWATAEQLAILKTSPVPS